MTARLQFAGGGSPISVARSPVDEWLREVLGPAVTWGGSHIGRTVVISPATEAGPRAHGEIPCFVLDREVVTLPVSVVGDTSFVVDGRVGATYAVSPEGVVVRPLVAGGDIRIGAFLAVREMLLAGGPPRADLHASAVAWQGSVVAFAGPKRAGKTATMAHVAASTGAAVVANDRLAVCGGTAWGVPTIVTLRPTTARALPATLGVLAARGRTVHLTRAAASSGAAAPAAPGRHVSRSLAQLADGLGTGLEAGGQLACVAFVHVDEEVRSFEVKPSDDGTDGLEACRFGGGPVATVFDPAPSSGAAWPDVRCVDVAVGPRFLGDGGAAAELVAAIVGS